MQKKNRQIILVVFLVLTFFLLSFLIENHNKKEKVNIERHSKVEDIQFDDDKVNIYFFWGTGCGHCEDEFKFFESIHNDYSKYYNLYSFEVWENPENALLLEELAAVLDQTTGGVPFTIIADKHFIGFGGTMGDEIKEAVKSLAKTDFDVYKKLLENKES